MPVPEEWNLAGKVAIVTCDRRGWTPYLASALAEAGADVAVAGSTRSDMAQAAEAVRGLARRTLAIDADLTVADEVESMIETVISEFGKVDVLVNNARVEFGKPFLEVTESEWDTVMDHNVKSMFLCCRAVGRRMLAHGGGRIVNVGSGLAARGLWNSAVACAAQGAIRQLTSALALEWATRQHTGQRHRRRMGDHRSALGCGPERAPGPLYSVAAQRAPHRPVRPSGVSRIRRLRFHDRPDGVRRWGPHGPRLRLVRW